ncbi:hypothetical protein F5Y18DRAFT_426006 [Xylariaceae sp. FL1019]|nr:hypothetical protein F5Y18DRAFT_426006 [Xylariaceae sp. FL1019]
MAVSIVLGLLAVLAKTSANLLYSTPTGSHLNNTLLANPARDNVTYPSLKITRWTRDSNSTQDPCSGGDFRLYDEYREDRCPPVNRYDPKHPGFCEGADNFPCTSFCQVSTEFTYGQESPIIGTYCEGARECWTTQQDIVRVKWPSKGLLEDQFSEALSTGVSGGFHVWKCVFSTREVGVYNKHLEKDECGYFTFVPILKTTCGTWTHGQRGPWGCENVTTEHHRCATQQMTDSKGVPDGNTIFVKTDCKSKVPLPITEQDPIYRFTGVGINQNYHSVSDDWAWDWCKCYYKVALSSFELRGKNWARSRLGFGSNGGVNGSRLQHYLGTCGIITFYRFHMNDDEEDSWWATGNLPIGTRNCVATQVRKAGGMKSGRCSGTG